MSAKFDYYPSTDEPNPAFFRLMQLLSPESITPEDAGRQDARESFAPLRERFKSAVKARSGAPAQVGATE